MLHAHGHEGGHGEALSVRVRLAGSKVLFQGTLASAAVVDTLGIAESPEAHMHLAASIAQGRLA